MARCKNPIQLATLCRSHAKSSDAVAVVVVERGDGVRLQVLEDLLAGDGVNEWQ